MKLVNSCPREVTPTVKTGMPWLHQLVGDGGGRVGGRRLDRDAVDLPGGELRLDLRNLLVRVGLHRRDRGAIHGIDGVARLAAGGETGRELRREQRNAGGLVGEDVVDLLARLDLGRDPIGELERSPVALHLERRARDLFARGRDLRLTVRRQRDSPAYRARQHERRRAYFQICFHFSSSQISALAD